MNENIFDKLDFGPFRALLDDDDITDISYDNNGQIWIRSLTQGSLRVEIEGATPEFVEKLAFQCSNVMGTTFNNAKPFLDAESAELRMNFVHQSIATNGIALVIRKTPAKIRLEKEKLYQEDYFTPAIHDFLIKCVEGHCNIMVAGETGSGKTEFVKYLASHTKTNEKIITIEDTLELHLDKIYPQRDIVAMKTNNVASYSDVLVTCMRQNPKWILLSEVRSAEAVSAVRNSISSGHNILSTIHADKASAIPYRLYSLMETDLDVNQFLNTIYRYIQIGVHIKAFYSKEYGKFHRELDEVCEFYVDDNNLPQSRIIYQKQMGKMMMCKPSDHLVQYIENQNIDVHDIIKDLPDELPLIENKYDEINIEARNDNIDGKQDNVAEAQVATDKNLDNVLNESNDTAEIVSQADNSTDNTQTANNNETVSKEASDNSAILSVAPVNEDVSAPASPQPEVGNVVNDVPAVATVTPIDSSTVSTPVASVEPVQSTNNVTTSSNLVANLNPSVSTAVPTVSNPNLNVQQNVTQQQASPVMSPQTQVTANIQPSSQAVVIESQNLSTPASTSIPNINVAIPSVVRLEE